MPSCLSNVVVSTFLVFKLLVLCLYYSMIRLLILLKSRDIITPASSQYCQKHIGHLTWEYSIEYYCVLRVWILELYFLAGAADSVTYYIMAYSLPENGDSGNLVTRLSRQLKELMYVKVNVSESLEQCLTHRKCHMLTVIIGFCP